MIPGVAPLLLLLLLPAPALADGWSEEDSRVIPDPVDKNSVRISGPWNQFNVTWTGVDVGRGRLVHYQVELNHVHGHSSVVSTLPL